MTFGKALISRKEVHRILCSCYERKPTHSIGMHNNFFFRTTIRDDNGSGLERISADFRYVGCGFGSDFRPHSRIWISATLWFGAGSTFHPRISVGAPKN
jgi:hypothetical protein